MTNLKLPLVARQEIIDYFLAKNNPAFSCTTQLETSVGAPPFVLLADDYSDLKVLETLSEGASKNVVQNSYWGAKEKLSTLFELATNPMKFLDKDFNVLNADARRYEFTFHSNTYINKFISDVLERINLDSDSTRTIPVLQTINELVMNAQHDAPANVSEILLPRDAADSVLVIEKNEYLMAISVIDDYGSLNIESLINKIKKPLEVGRGQSINFNQGGAGLGGNLVYTHCDTLLVGLDQFKKTRITSVLPYNLNEDKLSYIQKSICVIN